MEDTLQRPYMRKNFKKTASKTSSWLSNILAQTKSKSTGIPHSIFFIMLPLNQNLSSKT